MYSTSMLTLLVMRKTFLFFLFFIAAIISFAQGSEDISEDDEDDIKSYIDETKIRKEKLLLGKNAPPIDVALEPKEGDAIAYFPQPGKTPGTDAAQVSIGFTIFNNGPKKLT